MCIRDSAKALCICDMPISQEETIADFLGIPHKDLTFNYFGLNHFGWFTNIYDKDGNDLLPALRERVLSDEKVSLVNAEAEEKHDNYWGEMYKHVIEGFQAYPEFLPLVYISYYYFHNEIVSHMDLSLIHISGCVDIVQNDFAELEVVLAREQDGDDGGGVGRTGADDDKFIFLHGKGLLSRGKRFR